MEWPCFSSSLAREKTASAPSPFNCETRVAIRRVPMGSSLSFRGGRRRDGNAEAVNETRKLLECGGGQKQFDEFRLRKIGVQLREEIVVNRFAAFVQLVGEAEAKLFFRREGTTFEIGQGGNLLVRGTFLASGNAVSTNCVFAGAALRDTDRD